jgi:hypothetical protein
VPLKKNVVNIREMGVLVEALPDGKGSRVENASRNEAKPDAVQNDLGLAVRHL